jgi:hypothetical protein
VPVARTALLAIKISASYTDEHGLAKKASLPSVKEQDHHLIGQLCQPGTKLSASYKNSSANYKNISVSDVQ